jgi:hypothetical protein
MIQEEKTVGPLKNAHTLRAHGLLCCTANRTAQRYEIAVILPRHLFS